MNPDPKNPKTAVEAIETLAARWGALPAPVRASFAGIMLTMMQTEANKAHTAAKGFKYHTLDRRAFVCYSLEDAANIGIDLMRLLTFIADDEISQSTPDTYVPEALRVSEPSDKVAETETKQASSEVGSRSANGFVTASAAELYTKPRWDEKEQPWTLDLETIMKHMFPDSGMFHYWVMRLPYYVSEDKGVTGPGAKLSPATFLDLHHLCENKWLLLVALKVEVRPLVVKALCDVLAKVMEDTFVGKETELDRLFRRAVFRTRNWACDPTEHNSILAQQVGAEIDAFGQSYLMNAARFLTYLTSRESPTRIAQIVERILEEIESIDDPHGEDGDREPSDQELAEHKEMRKGYGDILRAHLPCEMLEPLVRDYAKRNNCEVNV